MNSKCGRVRESLPEPAFFRTRAWDLSTRVPPTTVDPRIRIDAHARMYTRTSRHYAASLSLHLIHLIWPNTYVQHYRYSIIDVIAE